MAHQPDDNPNVGPYLSVVVATRNDDHGGDPLKRLQAFINTFAVQCRRTPLDAELIVVEWNPPSDRPRVSELCRVPSDAPFPVRFVEVPAELHQKLRFGSVLPLFQMIAKNVGIRRARGRFILATNIDIIFSNELVAYLARGQLEPGCMYRVDRHDIESDFPVDAGLEEQMAYCQTHQIRLHTRLGTHAVDPLGRQKPLECDVIGPGFSLGEGWLAREGDSGSGFFRWVTQQASFAIDRTAWPNVVRGAVLDVELETNPYQPDSWVELEILDHDRQLARRLVCGRTHVRFDLEDGVSHHEIVMRQLGSSGGRECLPLLQAGERLSYRVRDVSLRTIPGHDYDIALWTRAFESPKLLVRHTNSGVEVTSDPGRYSDCVRYCPFESTADGVYEFLLEYTLIEGRVLFSIVDDDGDGVLPSTVREIDRDGTGATRLLSLSAELRRGVKFSLYISNNRPEGGRSHVVLRRLFGSAPFETLAREDLRVALNRVGRTVGSRTEFLVKPFRWLKAAVSSIELHRARRFHQTIVEDSERVRELEARVADLMPLTDLAPLARLLREHRPTELHQNACGDFQLMARKDWVALRGYPELEMFSMSIDGLFEAIACAAGAREQVFDMPLCIYHLEHEKGSGWSPEGEALLKKRIAESGITWLDAGSVHIWTAYMQWLRRPMIFNGPDWGFGDVTLPEKTFQPMANKV
jgi:hypothetical protein